MEHQYSQVNGPKLPHEEESYAYEALPWFDIGRIAIYLVTFAFLFTFARHLIFALF